MTRTDSESEGTRTTVWQWSGRENFYDIDPLSLWPDTPDVGLVGTECDTRARERPEDKLYGSMLLYTGNRQATLEGMAGVNKKN